MELYQEQSLAIVNIAPFLKGGLGVAIETMPGEKAYVFGIKGYYYFNKEFGKRRH